MRQVEAKELARMVIFLKDSLAVAAVNVGKPASPSDIALVRKAERLLMRWDAQQEGEEMARETPTRSSEDGDV